MYKRALEFGTKLLDRLARKCAPIREFLIYYLIYGKQYEHEREEHMRVCKEKENLEKRVEDISRRLSKRDDEYDTKLERIKREAYNARQKAELAERRAREAIASRESFRERLVESTTQLERYNALGELIKSTNIRLKREVARLATELARKAYRKHPVLFVSSDTGEILYASKPARRVLCISNDYDITGRAYSDIVTNIEGYMEITDKRKRRHLTIKQPGDKKAKKLHIHVRERNYAIVTEIKNPNVIEIRDSMPREERRKMKKKAKINLKIVYLGKSNLLERRSRTAKKAISKVAGAAGELLKGKQEKEKPASETS